MAPAERTDGGGDGERQDHVVEMVATTIDSDSDAITEDQITPLIVRSEKPKINIFTLPYPRRKSAKEQVSKLVEVETSPFLQFILWAWNGSRYSGLICVALSSTIYCTMEVISDVFSAQSIPLFETAFVRCTVILISSLIWLRKTGQPIFGPPNARIILLSRALVGYLSLLSFIYCVQRLSLSQAIILSFTTPIMASIAARIILSEKLRIAEIGGLACSFFGVLFIFRPMLSTQGTLDKTGDANDSYIQGSQHFYAMLIGMCSSIAGGTCYCLIRAGAKASDQPVVTVFSFGVIAGPAAAICTFTLQEFVFPSFHSFLLMVILGVLAFLAEVCLARGLQLEKTSKAANIQYIEAALLQVWSMGSSRVAPSFGKLVGCLLILVSAGSTVYIGPEKEVD